MSTISIEPLLRYSRRETPLCRCRTKMLKPFSLNFSPKLLFNGATTSFCNFKPHHSLTIQASSTDSALLETFKSTDVFFKEIFPLTQTQTRNLVTGVSHTSFLFDLILEVEGKIFIRLDKGENQQRWQLSVGCSLPGKWILHWGVSYVDDVGSEWDQPPKNMRPPGSVPIKDYAIETPLKKSSEEEIFHEVKINLDPKSSIAAINFVLKDEETGAWYQHRGRDFKVPLVDYLLNDSNVVGAKRGFNIWPANLQIQLTVTILGWYEDGIQLGAFLRKMLLKAKELPSKDQESSSGSKDVKQESRQVEGFYEEQPITKQVVIQNLITVSVTKCPKTAKNLLYLETDISGEVVLHWGVCRNDAKNWEIPAGPYPSETTVFKDKALRTLLQPKDGGNGCSGLFTIDQEFVGFLFVLKLNENTWLKCKENDFHIPLSSSSSMHAQPGQGQYEGQLVSEKTLEENQAVPRTPHSKGIINEIRNLVSDISSSRKTKTKEAQESILHEIEKLAAEAYSMFRSSIPTLTLTEKAVSESEPPETPKICSGTGTGFEILFQGFNWESHKSGRWYMELKEKALEISSLGFTVIWLPPPTESVSPEGYMPKDLYNLNSRYGSIDELKDLVKSLHEVGLKVLGDAVLNHRCAHFQNQNGVWNIFGGHLNWDDQAVVADDPHFQGRGNKSSGDNFHAAPNIDHSQDFVRKDLKEWLCWLRDEIGYDGWRLDFVKGFWGGYVKDYMDATEPYFAVGEYWDSLSYTYGETDHSQDAHRQRIIDWINATNGTAGAFDVTTKGILHAALGKCEYWRLSDHKGKPPGVMGWWPSRAVTFIENHDTGSTQGHWRFPSGKEMQGYAYILTHPGTPTVFYDHIFSHYHFEIASLIALRNRKKIHCRSTVKITEAERDVYAAIIDEKVAMKIGPGHYEPQSGSQRWSLAIEGNDYKVWEAS